jgi:MFS transporter, DHA1 family, multidrug resistance protein
VTDLGGDGTTAAPAVTTRQLTAVGVIVFGLTAIVFARVPQLPFIGRDLHLSATWLGLLSAVFGLARLAVDMPVGRLADRGRVMIVLALVSVIAMLSSLLLAAAYNLVVLLLAFVVLGIASATTNAAGMTYFSANVPVNRRGAALAALSTALLSGQILGPAGAGLVAELFSWRGAALAAAILGALLAAASLLLAPFQGRATVFTADAGQQAPAREDARWAVWALYSVPFATFFALSSTTQTLMPIIAADRFHLSTGAIGLALGGSMLGRVVFSQVGGVIADRVSRKAVLVPSLVFMAAGAVVLAAATSLELWLLGLFLFVGGSIASNAATALLADGSPPGQVGKRIGGYRFVGDVGLIVGPVLVTSLYQAFNSVVALAPVAALILGCAAAVAVFVREAGGARGVGS